MTAYTVHPGHYVAPPCENDWTPAIPPRDDALVHRGFVAPTPDILRRVLAGLRRLDTHPTGHRRYGTPHP